jgi:subtilisin family serine protease
LFCRKGSFWREANRIMSPVDVGGLAELMKKTTGVREIVIGLIDGPVALDHPDLDAGAIREFPGGRSAACSVSRSEACIHGTFVAGVLIAKRGSLAPAICPGCSLLIRPIFREDARPSGESMPSATAGELASAILDAVGAGVRVVNLSVGIEEPSTRGDRSLEAALDYAAWCGTLIVAAAGNQASIGSTAITRHPWVIPVVGCDAQGRPTAESNLGSSIGRRGLRAPGDKIVSLGTGGKPVTSSGTSTAAPFVTGALALLASTFPGASAAQLKQAITQSGGHMRRSLVPPLMNAWAAHQALAAGECR